MSPASSQPSLQHNGSTTDITNISMSLPPAPDSDLRTDGNAKFTTTAVPPKKPLTPYMKFSKSVSVSGWFIKRTLPVWLSIFLNHVTGCDLSS